MNSQQVWTDKKGRKQVVPFSDSTVRRFINRKHDPFPAGQLIGGKRYWLVAEIKDWMARQYSREQSNAGTQIKNGGSVSSQAGETASP